MGCSGACVTISFRALSPKMVHALQLHIASLRTVTTDRRRLLSALATATLLLSNVDLAQTGKTDLDDLLERPAGYGTPDPSPFREPALTVHAAPAQAVSLALPDGLTVRALEASPAGDQVALVTEDAAHRQQLAYWRFSAAPLAHTLALPAGMRITAAAWRPDAGRLFLLASNEHGSQILRVDPSASTFAPATIYATKLRLQRLAAGPRPFLGAWGRDAAYRLFFGEERPHQGFALRSITEDGAAPYTVVGPAPDAPAPEADAPPNTTIASWALPAGFHPSGAALIWEDARGCLHKKRYDFNNWQDSVPFGDHCGGPLAYTPNGIATLQWTAGKPGVRVRGLIDGSDQMVLGGYSLLAAPSQTPDGRGVIGLTRNERRESLSYLPVQLPLADVANAWMFLGNAADQQRFVRDRGLLRNLPQSEQIFSLYDSEGYFLSTHLPSRPYLVTTDMLWDTYAAAFEGLFIIVERERAMPALRKLVDIAATALGRSAPRSGLARSFLAAQAVLSHGEASNPEAQRIMNAAGIAPTPLNSLLDYRQLQPRGHYQSDAQQRHFRAMRYLSSLRLGPTEVAALRALGPETAAAAKEWIDSYRPFLAASRLQLVWGDGAARAPAATHDEAATGMALFPLSWAWDNEALDNVTYHSQWPPQQQIVTADRKGQRLLASGLDLAAIFGNAQARQLLDHEGLPAAYPLLAERISATAQRFATRSTQQPTESLYDQWIAALATQWASAPQAAEVSGSLWDTKRLQTGLASWATLRHATLLVNDTQAAEAGEGGGFEEIVLAPPRGYVEPDPATFSAIAALFEATAEMLRSTPLLTGDPVHDREARAGIVRRLDQARDDARTFQTIARKELAGQTLDPGEYAAIGAVGGTIEHSFLLFQTLSNPSYALSAPVPMMKVADVATSKAGNLEAAVGRPLEWDQVVPFSGRREIVKGAIYSYYELVAQPPLDDDSWRKRVDSQERPDWVTPFLSATTLTGPAVDP